MLRDALKKLARLSTTMPPFEPASLGDPLATSTEWAPARGGGANFRTHKLVLADTQRMEFRASAGALVFYAIFLLLGVGVSTAFLLTQSREGQLGLSAETLVPAGVGLLFAVMGGAMLWTGTKPIVFDRRIGFFWKGRKSPAQVFDRSQLKQAVRLEDIHAIQLLSEYCRGNKSSYYSYELNLVLHDGSRINVVDHGNRSKLQDDAAALAEFLDVPVWSAL